MLINKTKNTVKNSIWGMVNKCVTIILPFVIRTIIIRMLGTEYIGLNGLFTSILSVLNISELGISTAIVYSMYRPIAEENTEVICSLMRLYRIAYKIIACVVGVIGLLILPFLNKFIQGPVEVDINIYVLYLLYLGNAVLGYSLFAYKTCLFTAHQRNDVTYKVQTVVSILQYIVQMMVLIVLKNYYIYVGVLLFATIMQNLILAKKAGDDYPNYISKGTVPQETLRDIKRQIGGLLIGSINVTVRNSMDSIFVSSFIGLVAVGMYSNYYLIITSVISFISIISTSMVAGVGNSIVINSIEKNYDDFQKLTFITIWLVGFCSICILCLIQPFMRIWVGEDLMFNDSMAVICALYLLVGKIGLVRGIYSEAIGLWWKMKVYSIIDIPINLIMNFVFVYNWGAYGIILATVMCIGIYGVPYSTYILFKEYFGVNRYWQYMKSLCSYTAITCVIGAATYMICMAKIDNIYLKFSYNFLICMMVPNFLYFIIYRKNEYFLFTIKKMKEILGDDFMLLSFKRKE